MVTIYSLSDPRTNMVRYIGKTCQALAQRYYSHIRNDSKGGWYSANWIKSLKAIGLKPIMEVVDTVSDENWIEEEKFYINYFRFLGFPLTNLSEGGDGVPGHKPSEESNQKRRETLKAIGYKPSEEHFKKFTDGRSEKIKRQGFLHTKEQRERWSKERVGKAGKCNLGRKHTDETKAKVSAASKITNAKRHKPVLQFAKDGEFLNRFISISDAARHIGSVNKSGSICMACSKKNNRETAYGYIWKYENN